MMAAGVTAKQTAEMANEIGQAVAGLIPDSWTMKMSPSQGAALMDATLALFFAGVQYQDAAQRAWTVMTLQEVSRRLGTELCRDYCLGL